MKKAIGIIFLLLTTNVWGEPVTIGNEKIQLPVATNYVDINHDNPFYKAMESFTPATNKTLQVQISKEDYKKQELGFEPDYSSYISIQTFRGTENRKVTVEEFATVSSYMKEQQDALNKQLKSKIQDVINKGTKDLNNQYDTDMALTVSDNVPIEVFKDESHRFSSLNLVKYDVEDNGQVEKVVVVMALNILLVKGKILYTYVYGDFEGEDSLHEVKGISNKLTTRILKENNG